MTLICYFFNSKSNYIINMIFLNKNIYYIINIKYIDLHIQHRVYKNKDQGLLKTYLNYKLVMKE